MKWWVIRVKYYYKKWVSPYSCFVLCVCLFFSAFLQQKWLMREKKERDEIWYDHSFIKGNLVGLCFKSYFCPFSAQTLSTRVSVKNTGGACLCALLSALSFSSKSHPCFSTYNLTVCVFLFVLNYVSFLSFCVLLCLFALMALTVVTKFAFCKVSSLRFSASGLFFTRQQKGRNHIPVVARHVNLAWYFFF